MAQDSASHENGLSVIMTAGELLYYLYISDYQLHRNRFCYVQLENFPRPFYESSQNCEKRLLAPLCPSVCMEQVGSHSTEFHEILNLGIFSTKCRENSSFIKIAQE